MRACERVKGALWPNYVGHRARAGTGRLVCSRRVSFPAPGVGNVAGRTGWGLAIPANPLWG